MVTVHRPANVKWKIAVYGDEGRHFVPHYHIEGPGFRCSVAIKTGDVIIGEAPKRILAEAWAWAASNQQVLLSMYKELNS